MLDTGLRATILNIDTSVDSLGPEIFWKIHINQHATCSFRGGTIPSFRKWVLLRGAGSGDGHDDSLRTEKILEIGTYVFSPTIIHQSLDFSASLIFNKSFEIFKDFKSFRFGLQNKYGFEFGKTFGKLKIVTTTIERGRRDTTTQVTMYNM